MSTILHHINAHALENSDKTAIIDTKGESVTYGELWKNINLAAQKLSKAGLTKGQKVILTAKNDIPTIVNYFAIHLAGGINVVIDPKWTQEHICRLTILTQAHPPYYIQTAAISECDMSWTEMDLPKSGDVADIMFTSGTTGTPKCVPLTHANILGSAQNINSFIGNDSSDTELIALPMCHSFALGRMRCSLIKGATIVLCDGFANLKQVFDNIERYRVTGFAMVPAVFAYIKRFSGNRIGRYADQLRYIEIGSAAMPLSDKTLLMELFPTTRICMHYGMTEASRMTFVEFHSMAHRLKSVGRPASKNVELRIADDEGHFLAANAEGEICVRGNMVTPGYIATPQLRKEDYFVNGFFRTGDYGHIDDDGFLYLSARKKEIINVGGKKVNPIEIEEALESLGVGECMCIAIPDGILGEVPKVLLVEGTFTSDPDILLQELNTKLEQYKMPRDVEIVKSIPKTDSGKKIRT